MGVSTAQGGTREYAAPESEYGCLLQASMDVWAIGMLLHQVLGVTRDPATDVDVSAVGGAENGWGGMLLRGPVVS